MVSKIAFLFSIGLFSINLSSFASEMNHTISTCKVDQGGMEEGAEAQYLCAAQADRLSNDGLRSKWRWYQCAKSYSEDQRQLSDQNEIELQGIFEDYEHLFPILMPQEAIQNFYADTKKSFVVHFRDSFKNFPRPDFFRLRNINGKFINPINPINKMTGSMRYVGFFSAQYAYDIEYANNALIHKVRIHFKNPQVSQTQNDLQDFRLKIQEAQEIWNETPAKEAFQKEFGLDFNTRFQFEVVTDPRLAHFSVAIADTTRGPYFSEWARNWTPVAIAHEIGHMLGLGDEYQTVSGKDDCLDQSLMCQSWRGELMYHNYYHVLKRLF